MDRRWIAGLCICLAAAGNTAWAETETQVDIVSQEAAQAVSVQMIHVDRSDGSVVSIPAYERQGVLMAPLRQTAEQLGYSVTWNEDGDYAQIQTNIACMDVYVGKDLYERIGTLQSINLNQIFTYGVPPELAGNTLYVPVEMFSALFNDIIAAPDGVTISPQQAYLDKHGGSHAIV